MIDFQANKKTMLDAIQAMRNAQYPKQNGESPNSRQKWEAHHQECMGRIMAMIMQDRYQ